MVVQKTARCSGIMRACFVWPEYIASVRVIFFKERDLESIQHRVMYVEAVTLILRPETRTGVESPLGEIAIHNMTFGSNFFVAVSSYRDGRLVTVR